MKIESPCNDSDALTARIHDNTFTFWVFQVDKGHSGRVLRIPKAERTLTLWVDRIDRETVPMKNSEKSRIGVEMIHGDYLRIHFTEINQRVFQLTPLSTTLRCITVKAGSMWASTVANWIDEYWGFSENLWELHILKNKQKGFFKLTISIPADRRRRVVHDSASDEGKVDWGRAGDWPAWGTVRRLTREEEKEERVTSTPGLRSNGRSERVDWDRRLRRLRRAGLCWNEPYF